MTEELDIKEAAALCKCSDKTLRRRIKEKAGHPPYWTIGLRYCFDRQAVIQWRDSNTVHPAK